MSPHLGEIALSQGLIYLANSFDSLTIHRVEADGTLGLVFQLPSENPRPRCTTIAIHEASHTLYCSSERAHDIVAFDLSDAEHPFVRDAHALSDNDFYVRDLHVDGDTLYVARFGEGLWTAGITADGALESFGATAIAGDARFVSGSGGRIVLLTADRGLVTLTADGGALTEDGSLELDGPAVGLTAHDGRALVALGSAGARLVDVAGAPVITASVSPPGVVTSGDFQGEVLAVSTLSGLFAYDLADRPARAVGFAPTSSVMLDVRFAGSDLIASDFWFTERFTVNPAGNMTNLDMPRGIYFASGSGLVIPFRNAGRLPLRATLLFGGMTIGDVLVAPGATEHFTMTAEMLAGQIIPGNPTSVVFVTTLRPSTQEALTDLASSDWKAWDMRPISLVSRPVDADPAAGFPAPGDAFPPIKLADASDQVFSVPTPSTFRAVFYSKDCIAMWAELADAAWLERSNQLDGGAVPVFIGRDGVQTDGFAARFGIEGSMTGYYGSLAPAEVTTANAQWGANVYESGFEMGKLPSGAQHPTDYLVDETGVVKAVERVYYGAWPLR